MAERPEVNMKQVDLLERVDDIQGTIFEIKKDLDGLENEDFMK